MYAITLVATFLLGAAIATVVAWVMYGKLRADLAKAQRECTRLQAEMQAVESCGEGIDAYTQRLNARKEEGKAQILEALGAKESITNTQIVDLLGVSSATAVRYMDELEQEGRVRQVGSTGRGVYYALNTSHPA